MAAAAAAAAAGDVTVPEDGPQAAGVEDGESDECSDDDVVSAPSHRSTDSESTPESSPKSSPQSSPGSSRQSSPEISQKHERSSQLSSQYSAEASPAACRKPSPDASPTSSPEGSPEGSPAGSPTLPGRRAAACELQYSSDGEEKGSASGRDPDGWPRGRPVECRNPVLCDRSEHPDGPESPASEQLQSVGSAETSESGSPVPSKRVESTKCAESAVERAESLVTAARGESPSHPLSESVEEDHPEGPPERAVEAPGSDSVGDSRLELVPADSDFSTDDEGSGGAITRFLRASMRKMLHFRLSSGQLRRRSSASQPTPPSPSPSTRTAMEARAARAARRTSDDQVCCSPSGDEQDSSPPPGTVSGAAPSQSIRMSTLLDRLNGAAGTSGVTASTSSSVITGADLIQVSTREPHLHDAPLPALEETDSVAFDTPPPPLPEPSSGAERTSASTSRATRLLSRGSSFLGVYQTVPELSDQEEARRAGRRYWQHNYSSPLACLTCTVGLSAICRFALFGGTYGVAFVIQFFILSLLVGMPLMTLHMTMGQYIGSGIVDMWRISPIFKGIGLAAVLAELLLGVYTVVPIAWMLVYLRDSFVSSYDQYKWALCPGNCSVVALGELVTYTVPQYFNQRVLQRNMSGSGLPEVGYLGFEISFNLAVTWILVYLSLGRGLRSYGKVVYAIVLLAMISFFTVCIQLLSWTEGLNEFFTDKFLFDNVFWSTVPWVVAARETFMIWGLHGAALMAITSHNKFNHNLRRDTTLVAFFTLVVLFLSALFGYACLHVLRVGENGPAFTIGSSSFETEHRSRFLIAAGIGSSHSGGTPPEIKHYTNLVSGVIIKLSAASEEGTVWSSGYQVHRLAVEIFPSLLAAVTSNGISSFWALVFYLAMLLFGVGQQLAIWRSVVEAVISMCPAKLRSWELTTTFVLCVTGFGLSLPLMTDIGIHIIYFLDYCVGCLWWLVVIYVLELFAVFYIRGTPFASTQVVTILIANNGCMTNWAGPFLSFVWHVLLPMALLVLSVVSFRTGGFDAIFTWDEGSGYGYWGLWVRQLGSMIMMFPILLVPIVGLIQAIRYVRAGEGDLYDRVQSLYRPEYNESILGRITPEEEEEQTIQRTRTRYTDPPPKYTPPPSYSTATGARLAKMLRQSMRRSMRAVRQLAGGEAGTAAAARASSAAERGVPADPPPSYASLLMESMPAPLRRSLRRFSLRRTAAPPERSVAPPAVLTEEGTSGMGMGRGPAPPLGHQRSFSLGLLRQLPADSVPPVSRSLPRDLTPEQVREVLRSGRLSLPESAAPRQLTPDEVRQVLRGGTTRGLPRPASRAESLIDATLEEETTDA